MNPSNPLQQVFTPGTQRTLIWVGLVFFVVVLGILIAGFARKKLSASAPSGGVGQDTKPDGTPAIDVLSGNLGSVEDIAEKAWQSVSKKADYQCEVTNNLLEMGDNDLRILLTLYQKRYNRDLRRDYCENWKTSGCWNSWFESKETDACNRIQNFR